MALFLLAAMLAAAAPGDEAAIRAVRAETNAAIAAHDVARLAASFTDDVVLVSGGGDAFAGRDGLVRAFTSAFAAPGFVDYVRTPLRIEIAGAGPRAAEHGRWLGRWRTSAGETRRSGIYLAQWLRAGGGWRIRAELYVTLACAGPGC